MYFGINTDCFRMRQPEAAPDGEPIRIFAQGTILTAIEIYASARFRQR